MQLEFARPGFCFRHGDSRQELDRLLRAGRQFDVAFADVPYGLGLAIVGDESAAATAGWSVPLMLALLKPGASLLCWNASSTADVWVDTIISNGGTVHEPVTWNKGNPYFDRRSKELLIVASKGPVLTTYNDDVETSWVYQTVRDEQRRELHKTPKPIPAQKRALRRFAPPGCRVLDAFGGGGDIALACLQLGLRYQGFEIVPRHVEGAVQRLELAAAAQLANARLRSVLQQERRSAA